MGRYFWGIEVPGELGERLEEWIARYGREIPAKRWYDRSLFHVTLLFFGDLIDGKIHEVNREADRVAENSVPFILQLGDVGSFARSKVVWQGLQPSAPLFELRHRLWRVAEDLRVAGNDRPSYRPHITLGRLAQPWRPENLEESARSALAGRRFVVNHFNLYESRLTPSGPEYRVVRRFAFARG
ncbi:MAG: RNA 2',3'-cyclic phosphodiesterase [Alicyclobacillaceae bacterium]|nr:RNA 2',3'-cyclic phosphodiesterase [Alicyclobacillaceae bacterium]